MTLHLCILYPWYCLYLNKNLMKRHLQMLYMLREHWSHTRSPCTRRHLTAASSRQRAVKRAFTLRDAGSQLGQQQCQLCRATWVSPRLFLARAAALFHCEPLQHKVMAGEQCDTRRCAAHGALQEQGLLRLAKDVVSLQQERPYRYASICGSRAMYKNHITASWGGKSITGGLDTNIWTIRHSVTKRNA